jgi:hypothetical protein
MEKPAQRRGRPPQPESERRRSNLTFRVRAHLRHLLQLRADHSGRSLSEEIEHRLERSLSEEVLLYGVQDPVIFLNAVNMITIVLASLERQTGRKAFGPDGDPWLHEQAWSALNTWFAATRPPGDSVPPSRLSRSYYRAKSPPKSVINVLGSIAMTHQLSDPGGPPDLEDFRALIAFLREIRRSEKEAQPEPNPGEGRAVFEELSEVLGPPDPETTRAAQEIIDELDRLPPKGGEKK